MSEGLPTPAPDFDQPVAVLKHCHDRIRKQLKTLEQLPGHLREQGVNVDAQQAATAVMRYFNQAAGQHHADEEQDLIPMLQDTAQGEDAATLSALLPRILAEHREMDELWQKLNAQLQAVAAGSGTALDDGDVQRFCALYGAHMEIEEGNIAPMAKRLFSASQMSRLGNAMRARRGIPCDGAQ